jgi:cobalt-zinc-cadmium efflux system protein
MAHHHHSHAHHEHADFSRAFAISIALNFAFTVTEAYYAFFAHSMTLLADAGHNLSDVLALAMAWGASWLLTRRPTERYSYGYKRTSILAALANALLLVLTSTLIAYESLHKFLTPVSVNEHIIIVVALIGIVINSSTALLFRRGKNKDLNIKGAYLHLAYDALISVGVVATGTVILYTKWIWLDPIVALIIVALILTGTFGLLRDSVNLMLDAVPSHIDQKQVRSYLNQLPGVTAVHDLHIWGLSTHEIALTAHLVMPKETPTDADYQTINEHLKHQFAIDHVTLQVERGSVENPCTNIPHC